MSSKYKKFIYNGLVGGTIASYLFFKVTTVHAASLTPGIINSCGEMDDPGIYVIAEDFTTPDSSCFIVRADNVTIIGATSTPTPTITGPSSVYSFVVVEADIFTGSTYGTTTIQNLNINGFSSLVSANAVSQSYVGGSIGDISIMDVTADITVFTRGAYGSLYGGFGGNISITNSTLGSLYSKGGDAQSGGAGNGGNITLTNSTINGPVDIRGGGSVGNAGFGGNIILTDSITGNIYSTGGTSSGSGSSGNGGNIFLTDSVSGDISANGGSGQYGGIAGNGGYVSVLNSVYGNISVAGGYSGGSDGTINFNLVNLDPGVIDSCGVLDDENGIYIIEDATYLTKNKCLRVEASNVTILGSTSTNPVVSADKDSFITVGADSITGDGFGITTIQNLTVNNFAYLAKANGVDENVMGYGGDGGIISLIDVTTSGAIRAYGGFSFYGTGGAGGTITVSGASASGNIGASGGFSASGTGGVGGTVSLSEASSVSGNIFAIGVSSSSGTGGVGGTVSLSEASSVSGNIFATGGSSPSGTGGAGGNVTLSDTSTSGYIRASGGSSSYGTGGNGGEVSILGNSLPGNIYAEGGFSDGGSRGYAGAINISGTNMTFFSLNPTLDVSGSTPGNITVDGSTLFNTNEFWMGNATDWAGTATWSFFSNSENQGVVKGNAEFRDIAINQVDATVTGSCDLFDDSQNLGTCNPSIYHQGYFFRPGLTENWDNPDNWFTDPGATSPLGFVPTYTNETIWLAGTTTGPTSETVVGTIKVANNITGGGIFGIDISNVFLHNPASSVSFFNGGFTTGIINGTAKFFSSLLGGISNIITGGGQVKGDVEFYNDTYNDVDNVTDELWTGDTLFYDTSYNDTTGVINTATFNEGSENRGEVTTGTFNGSSINASMGSVDDATFNDNSVNLGTLISAIFSDSSSNDGVASGDATFESGTHNSGTISGDATFEGTSYNIGTSTNATFVGEYSENYNGANEGIVTGIKTRLYNASNQQYNLLRNFADSAWTIVANNTFVKLLYRNLIDIFGGSPTTTLVEEGDGFILHPALTTNITKCGVLDTASTTYVLQNNITNFKYDSCFIITADNVTLDGNNKILDGLSTSTALYAIISASTTATTTGASAYQNLTVKNLTVTQFGTAIDARGRNNASGNGGGGGTVSLDDVVLNADVLADGGNGTANGGNAGDVNLLNSNLVGEQASTTISMNGGNSTSCGNGGNAGFIDSVDSDFDLLSQTAGAGEDSGCAPEVPAPTGGTSGGTRRQTGTYTPPSLRENTGGNTGGDTGGENAGVTKSGGSLRNIIRNTLKPLIFNPIPNFTPFTSNFNPTTIGSTLIPDPFKNFRAPGLVDLIKLPVNFLTNISKFLFAPLPSTITEALSSAPKLAAYIGALGVSKEQDIATLASNPTLLKEPLSDESTPPGLFLIRSGEQSVSSYATYDKAVGGLAQLIKVSPNQSLSISLIPLSTGEVIATYQGQTFTFTQGSLFAHTYIQTPAQAGRYVLSTKSSPIPLLIDVIAPVQAPPQSKPWGIFNFAWKWFNPRPER